jgi:hypothetical protein
MPRPDDRCVDAVIAYVCSRSMPAEDRAVLPPDAAEIDGDDQQAVDAAVASAMSCGATQVRVVCCRLTPELCRNIASGRVWYMPYRGRTLRYIIEHAGSTNGL